MLLSKHGDSVTNFGHGKNLERRYLTGQVALGMFWEKKERNGHRGACEQDETTGFGD